MSKNNQGNSPAFLYSLGATDRDWLLKRTKSRCFRKGQQIIRVKENDANFYLINSGVVRVTLFSTQGREISFVDIGPGGNFGELSAIDGMPRSANVIARSDTEITVISPELLVEVLKKFPDAGIELLRQLAAIIRRLCDRIFEYSTLDVSNRISLELLRLSARNLDLDGVARIHNPPTQLEMASRVSCTRESVSREYNKLKKLGIIRCRPKTLIVENFASLQALVDDTLA
jgi:CRP-like cAMP-binding protein